MKTIFSGIINFIIVIIVTLAIFATFLFLNTNENGIVTVGDGSIISINDESMKGTLDKGDLIVVYKQSIENVVENDVVTYLYEEENEIKVLTGRVYLVNQEDNQTNLVLKGDAQSEEEIVTINATNIVGKWNNSQKMVFVGSVYDFILSPLGFIIVITIPLVMLLGYVIIKLIKKQKKNKNNIEEDTSMMEQTTDLNSIEQETPVEQSPEVINTDVELPIPQVSENIETPIELPIPQVTETIEPAQPEEIVEQANSSDDDIEVL